MIGIFGNHSRIELIFNPFTRFESGVFQPVLEQMAPFGGYEASFTSILMVYSKQNTTGILRRIKLINVSICKTGGIDCVTDHCHLAWLIRDNPHLLIAIDRPTCLDGRQFKDLDPKAFADCPVTTIDNIV